MDSWLKEWECMARNDFNNKFGATDQFFGNFEDGRKARSNGGPITETKIPLKSANKNINKKGQPDTQYFSNGGSAKGKMPARNKKNFRSTKSGAGMTRAGVKAYRRANPGSKLKTAVTGKVKPGSKAAKRRKSYCARSLGQLKRSSAKTRNDPNSRIRQARRRWKC